LLTRSVLISDTDLVTGCRNVV